jgi:dihydrofolate reductase
MGYSRFLAAVVVTDLNQGIGYRNKLLCHLPADLKFFKTITMGFPIIMGRKTYESIGRVLPRRRNLIITRRSDYRVEGAEIFHSLESALRSCREEKVFVIGGSEIFWHAWPLLTEIYRTQVQSAFEADTWFPEIQEAEFSLEWKECHEADEKNIYPYCFEKWVRKTAG